MNIGKGISMKCRIVKPQCMYYGEVYGNWNSGECWKRVTQPCLTKWGAKRELKAYKKRLEAEDFVEEFEL